MVDFGETKTTVLFLQIFKVQQHIIKKLNKSKSLINQTWLSLILGI